MTARMRLYSKGKGGRAFVESYSKSYFSRAKVGSVSDTTSARKGFGHDILNQENVQGTQWPWDCVQLAKRRLEAFWKQITRGPAIASLALNGLMHT